MNIAGSLPIGSMYGIVTYIWLMFIVNEGKYDIPYMDGMGYKISQLTIWLSSWGGRI